MLRDGAALRVKEVDLTPDDAFKLLMSMGIIQPESRVGPLAGVPRLAGEPPFATRPGVDA